MRNNSRFPPAAVCALTTADAPAATTPTALPLRLNRSYSAYSPPGSRSEEPCQARRDSSSCQQQTQSMAEAVDLLLPEHHRRRHSKPAPVLPSLRTIRATAKHHTRIAVPGRVLRCARAQATLRLWAGPSKEPWAEGVLPPRRQCPPTPTPIPP
jgi:hypothetical protein